MHRCSPGLIDAPHPEEKHRVTYWVVSHSQVSTSVTCCGSSDSMCAYTSTKQTQELCIRSERPQTPHTRVNDPSIVRDDLHSSGRAQGPHIYTYHKLSISRHHGIIFCM